MITTSPFLVTLHSDPSRWFVILHLRNENLIISVGISCCAPTFHGTVRTFFGSFLLVASCHEFVNSVCHPLHTPFLTSSLNGLFKSKGCKIEVKPPKITAKLVFSQTNVLFTLSLTQASYASQTSRLLLLPRPPPHYACQTLLIHIFIPLESIQPFALAVL